MSSLQQFSDGRRGGKAPERSNFLQTCNLLSQYLKEKGGLRDLNLGIGGKLEAAGKRESATTTTVDLLTTIEKPSPASTSQPVKPIDPFPQNTVRGTSSTMEEVTNEANTSKGAASDPKTAQMTIFYAGKVMVFDDFPADRARAVMLLASKGKPQSSSSIFSTTAAEKINPGANSAAVVPSSTSDSPNSGSCLPKPRLQPQSEANGSDLPIARRSSLHRFLEKRKDRATARAPYQAHNSLASSSKDGESSVKNGESSSKIEDQQLDLKL